MQNCEQLNSHAFLHIYFCCIVNLLDHQLVPCLSHHKNILIFTLAVMFFILLSMQYTHLSPILLPSFYCLLHKQETPLC